MAIRKQSQFPYDRSKTAPRNFDFATSKPPELFNDVQSPRVTALSSAGKVPPGGSSNRSAHKSGTNRAREARVGSTTHVGTELVRALGTRGRFHVENVAINRRRTWIRQNVQTGEESSERCESEKSRLKKREMRRGITPRVYRPSQSASSAAYRAATDCGISLSQSLTRRKPEPR